jgi:hypothetical protein
MQDMFPFKAMKETNEQRKTKIDIDELKSGTTNITLVCMGVYRQARAGYSDFLHLETFEMIKMTRMQTISSFKT